MRWSCQLFPYPWRLGWVNLPSGNCGIELTQGGKLQGCMICQVGSSSERAGAGQLADLTFHGILSLNVVSIVIRQHVHLAVPPHCQLQKTTEEMRLLNKAALQPSLSAIPLKYCCQVLEVQGRDVPSVDPGSRGEEAGPGEAHVRPIPASR